VSNLLEEKFEIIIKLLLTLSNLVNLKINRNKFKLLQLLKLRTMTLKSMVLLHFRDEQKLEPVPQL